MDEETRDLWVLALRSGRYRQGKHRLVTNSYQDDVQSSSYCCLGVLCAFKGWNDGLNDGGGLTDGPEELIGNGEMSPFAGGEKVGASGLTFEQRQRLSEMNDSGDSFTKIADWIETHL